MGLQSPIVRGLGAQNVERGFNLAPRRGPPHKLTKSGRFCYKSNSWEAQIRRGVKSWIFDSAACWVPRAGNRL